MSLKHSYSLIAPFYDFAVKKFSTTMREKSIKNLGPLRGKKVLIAGVGTGLDLPFLPKDAVYNGCDITPAMLKIAHGRAEKYGVKIDLKIDDVMDLSYADNSFDIVIMHLILAVVPDSYRALQECSRVLKKDGKIIIIDKFLQKNQPAPIRRFLSPLVGKIATRLDVVFEDLLDNTPALKLIKKEPLLGSDWFYRFELSKI
ncbi:MAG: phosphatidylethanolamine N-methyltransferase [Gammaproteobacteria bacterium]|nr:MAG: phosphatidylethanolamine N-methyltransferase [Gammaproteobacteria bacterium]